MRCSARFFRACSQSAFESSLESAPRSTVVPARGPIRACVCACVHVAHSGRPKTHLCFLFLLRSPRVFAAPELCRGGRHNFCNLASLDYWSVGALLHFLLTGECVQKLSSSVEFITTHAALGGLPCVVLRLSESFLGPQRAPTRTRVVLLE